MASERLGPLLLGPSSSPVSLPELVRVMSEDLTDVLRAVDAEGRHRYTHGREQKTVTIESGREWDAKI